MRFAMAAAFSRRDSYRCAKRRRTRLYAANGALPPLPHTDMSATPLRQMYPYMSASASDALTRERSRRRYAAMRDRRTTRDDAARRAARYAARHSPIVAPPLPRAALRECASAEA
jgi:hypothetical protein